jgi:SAM-dependent methyltransferase
LDRTRAYRQSYYDDYPLPVDPQDYLGHYLSREFPHWAKATRKRLGPWLPADLNTPVLDLGCGFGAFLRLLEQLGYTDLTGVDLGPAQIAVARQGCPRSKIMQSDLREFLEAADPGSYGLITGFQVIEHFTKEEILPLLALINRALYSGGRVIFETPNAASPWWGAVAYGDFTHEWFFTPAGLGNILRNAGLVSFEARPCGPYVHGVKSFIRVMLWQVIHLGLTLVNLVECGGLGHNIHTRGFLGTAIKP